MDPIDERYVQNLLDTLEEFRLCHCKQTPLPAGPTEINSKTLRGFRSISHEGFAIYIWGECRLIYDKLIRKLGKLKWSRLRAEEYVSSLLDRTIILYIRDQHNGVELVREMVEKINAEPPRFKTYIPLFGVELRVPELKIGNIRLMTVDDVLHDELMELTEKIIARSKNPKEQHSVMRSIAEEGIGTLMNRVCAEITVQGDPAAAEELAESACLPVIDYLQLLCGVYVHTDRKIRIGYGDLVSPGFRAVVMVSETGDHVNFEHKRVGPAGAFVINEHVIAKAHETGLDGLAEILSKSEDSRSDVEALLIQAMHWFANGESQLTSHNKLLSYVTCLDMFFSDPRTDVTRSVAEGVAFLMADDFATRSRIYDFVKRMYELRSAASHRGERPPIDDELPRLRELTVNVIANLLKRRGEFKQKEDIQTWTHRTRLG